MSQPHRPFISACLLTCLLAPATTLAQSVRYVDDDASTNGDGTTWGTAYRYLQDALAAASADPGITEIRVAGGVYTPDQDEGGHVTPGDRTASFELVNGVKLKGGYAGIGAPDPDDRDIALFETILSGDLAGDDGPDPFENDGENSYHVVTGSGTDSTAVLDGFIIRAGHANEPSEGDYNKGGGFFTDGGSPTLRHCAFRYNRAADTGGGLDIRGSSTTALIYCTMVGNRAQYGGGVQAREASPTLIGCLFAGNRVGWIGGGMRSTRATPTLTGCTFTGNTADEHGAGLHVQVSSTATVVNCTFAANTADDDGGGIFIAGSDATIASSIFWGNSDGGGTDESAQVHVSSGITTVNYSCIQGWTGGLAVR